MYVAYTRKYLLTNKYVNQIWRKYNCNMCSISLAYSSFIYTQLKTNDSDEEWNA